MECNTKHTKTRRHEEEKREFFFVIFSWIGRVRRSDIGWTAEIELPFRTLNFDPDGTSWGINFQRTVRRTNEESVWSGFARNQGLLRMTNA